jgi:DNA-binding transcriptional LysR family regulator
MVIMNTAAGIDLNALAIFCMVARLRGFTAAAMQLGMTKAKVSIQISRLEKHLGTPLFTRTTRQVNLTDAGRRLFEQCEPMLGQLQETLDQLGEDRTTLSGTLRLSSTVDHSILSLASAVAIFARRHPDLHIDLRSSDRVQDLVSEGIDASIRVGWLRDSSMRAIKLGGMRQFVVGSPAYLRDAKPILTPADLADHPWICLSLLPAPLTWTFEHANNASATIHVRSRIRVDSPGALRAMLREGYGISILDEHSVTEDIAAGRLEAVLPQWTLPQVGIYAVYPPSRRVSYRAQRFIDFYRGYLNDLGTIN